MNVVSKKILFNEAFTLGSGELLPGFELMTETYGKLNQEKSNAVLVCHAFSGNHHAAGIKEESAYYESLHETPLIANTIARKKLFEMNRIISDTAEYGCYLFDHAAKPLLNNFMKEIKTDVELELFKDAIKKERHQNILEIRQIIKKYNQNSKIHLGGIPMIADDMMSFIKSDILVFGFGVFTFIIITLWIVFKNIKWVIMPLLGCITSVIIMIVSLVLRS